MSNMTKLLILTLAAAALGAGVPQAPSRPEENLRFPVEDRDVIRLKMKREVMDDEASESENLRFPVEDRDEIRLKMKREVKDDEASESENLRFPTSGARRQSRVLEEGQRIELKMRRKRDLPRSLEREAKYLERLELQPIPSRKFETRSMTRVYDF